MIFLPLYLLSAPADANQEGISKIGWKTVVCHITIISGKKKKNTDKSKCGAENVAIVRILLSVSDH